MEPNIPQKYNESSVSIPTVEFTYKRLQKLLERPIAFYPIFADVAGGVSYGVFLAQAFYWSGRTNDPDGWFYKTQSEWQQETRLTRREQESARKHLKKKGILEEERRGLPARMYYRLNKEILTLAIMELTDPEPIAGNQEISPPKPKNDRSDNLKDRRENLKPQAKDVSSIPQKEITDNQEWRNPPNWNNRRETAKQDCTKRSHQYGGIRQTGMSESAIHSICTESTTETTPTDNAKSTFAGGGGDAHASNGNDAPDPLNELVESVYHLGTGLSRSIIRDLVSKHPDHARVWVKWWRKAPESRPEYWNNRKGSPAGALRLRLTDPARLPMQVVSQNKAREAQAAAERAAQQKKVAQAEEMAQNQNSDRKRRERARKVWEEYMCLAEPLRQQVDSTVAQRNPLLGQKLARFGGNVDKLDPRSLIYASFMEAAEGIMGEIEVDFNEGDWV